MKIEGLRQFKRYRIKLPIELQSIDAIPGHSQLPPLRFKTKTRDISLGGLQIDLVNHLEDLDPNWQTSWFRDRYFWIHLMGISTIPEGLFSKAKVVHLEEKDNTRPEGVGMEFQDLHRGILDKLKQFLNNLTTSS